MSNSDSIMVKVNLENVLKVKKCEYKWTIRDEDLYPTGVSNSPTFYSEPNPNQTSVGWYLNLTQNEDSVVITDVPVEWAVGYTAYRVSLLIREPPASVCGGHVSLHVKSKRFTKHFDRDFTTVGCFVSNSTVYSFSDFIPFFFYMCDNTVTLTCSIVFFNLSDITKHFVSDQKVTVPLVEPSGYVDGKRFAASYLDKKHSDVTLCVNGKSYTAHKIILAGCSSVFQAMFDHDMKESNQNLVVIEDINEQVFLEALRFMYTGQIENFEELVCDLLPVADRYDMKELKELCVNALYCKRSVNTVMQILLIADSCNVPCLKKEAIEFILKNSKDVKVAMSPEEREEIKRRPNLMMDLIDGLM